MDRRWYTPIPLALALVLLLPAATHAAAFDFSGVGGKAGVVIPEDGDNALALGLHFEFERPGSQWHIAPEVIYWSEDIISDTNVNLNAYYHFRPSGQASPYLGGGVGLHLFSFDAPGADDETEFSVNGIAGMRFPAGENAYFFAEGRYVAMDLSMFELLAGLTWRLGHGR